MSLFYSLIVISEWRVFGLISPRIFRARADIDAKNVHTLAKFIILKALLDNTRIGRTGRFVATAHCVRKTVPP